MNEQDRREIEQISQYQKELREYLGVLEARIEELKRKVSEEPITPSIAARPLPPPLSRPAPSPAAPNMLPIPQKKAVPPPLPQEAPEPVAPKLPPPEPSVAKTVIPPPSAPEPSSDEADAEEAKSFEMRVGTHWLVRAGIVIMLTGLVFFSKYAYDHYILNFGPGGKIALLYVLSAGLLGTGLWLARSRESMRNFGNVLTAGGMAAVYYTTYAAHYKAGLQVIQSPLLAGILLLGWSAVMVGVADRKKSQSMALLAVLLAYYTTTINAVSEFTLYSNLVLTAVGVLFLIRNRWAGLTYVSLVGTYVSYGFWRFYHDQHWIFDRGMTVDDFWKGNLFLLGYWILFTVAVLWSKHENFTSSRRATFLTLNNGAFFVHVIATLQVVYPGSFWKFALPFGGVLIVLAWFCRLRHPEDASAEGSYLVQGLALVTAGIVDYYSGRTLAAVLGAETVILLVCGYLQNNRILKAGAFLIAPLAVAFTLHSLGRYDREGLWLAVGVGSAMIFSGWWIRRQEPEEGLTVQGKPAYFAFLGLLLWMVATMQNVAPENRAIALAIEALILTFSIYLIRMPEVTFLGQFFLVLAQMMAITQMDSKLYPWWNPASVIVSTLIAGHWWQHQKTLSLAKSADSVFQLIYGLAVVGVLYFWLEGRFEPAPWLVVTSCVSIGMLFYGIVTRAWFLALLGQFFLFISGLQFLVLLARDHPAWYASLVPVATVLSTALIVGAILRDPSREQGNFDQPLLWMTRIYRWIAMVMFVCWVFEYVPRREQVWTFMLSGFLLYAWGALSKNGTRMAISGIVTAVGLFIFFLVTRGRDAVYWPNAVVLILLLSQQQIGKQLLAAEDTPGRAAFPWIIAAGVIGFWVLISRWVWLDFSKFALTGTWGVYALAVFLAGFALRERVYRLLGLGILASCVVKIFVHDIWKVDPLFQWITLFIVAGVLILLGFFYNRFQEKIKSWL